jgi:Nucleotidyl transferase AbiEii toxin, Type IV TA system
VWRRLQVEVAPDEAGAGDEEDVLQAPGLGHFGLPNPDFLVGIALRYQIAQKIHACTDPHDPPDARNDRARDVVDLLLLRDLAALEGTPTHEDLREACTALFAARAADARALARTERGWPPNVVAHQHWSNDYEKAALDAGVDLPLGQAVDDVNAWIALVESAHHA